MPIKHSTYFIRLCNPTNSDLTVNGDMFFFASPKRCKLRLWAVM